MRNYLFRLGGAVMLWGLTVGAAPPALLDGAAIIVEPGRLISSNKIDAIDPGSVTSPITMWSYDADFKVTSQLAGPDVGKSARISFIDQRAWRPEKLFMIVHRDGRGRLWARRAWQQVDSELCLSAQQVAKLGLIEAFALAQNNGAGERCIKV